MLRVYPVLQLRVNEAPQGTFSPSFSSITVAAFLFHDIFARVESFGAVAKGLPKTAIAELEPIIQRALKEKAYAEAIKAIGRKTAGTPDPDPLSTFVEAVRTRGQSGGHAEAAHRAVTIPHLPNISIRIGRRIYYDPAGEQIIGEAEANRLVNQPMRAPWHL